MTDASGITTYRYDAFGNLRQQTKTELGVSYTTSYTYDAGNRVNTLTYPDGRILTYTRDAIGRISDISMTVGGTTTSLLNGISYRADGLIKSQTFGNGLTETRAYDLQGRLTSQTVGNIINQTYSYDANGNLVTLPEGTYSYDVLDRLIQTSLSTQNNRYTYEGNGDILNASFSIIQSSIRNDRYTYTSDGQLASYTQNDIPTASYTYNAQHQRTRKVANSTTIYHYDLQGNLIQESDSTGAVIRSYVWLNQTPIAQIDRNGTTETLTYLHVDHLNTPRWGTNSTGVLVWQWAGEAFGQDQPEEDPDQDGNLTTVNLRYPGQYYDAESGLHYNWNRYYDPRTGRYITSDPIGLRGGLNTYAYVENNPLAWADMDGLAKGKPGGIVIPFPPAVPGTPSRLGVGDVPGVDDDGGTSRERCKRQCSLIGQYIVKRYKPGDFLYDPARPGLAKFRCDYRCPDGSIRTKEWDLREGYMSCPRFLSM